MGHRVHVLHVARQTMPVNTKLRLRLAIETTGALSTYIIISLLYGFCQSLNTSVRILANAAFRLHTINSRY